ncbi:hypothetical protein Nepgr_001340 [Nepenthes gracilis]|uniref:RING-type E3 ubiquitin transferase n=1 Tax=Nepenthes gracilis TaxID=150966 RepID=A0AAD3P497_NEPGR|nr:hypothetical protein Nepgr_001340 [Nepenthes gracilis]
MNDSISPSYDSGGTDSQGTINYSVVVFIFVFVVIILVIFITFIRARTHPLGDRRPPQVGSMETDADRDHGSAAIEEGLDEATLSSFPKLTYSQAKLHDGGATAACCSVCLGDYKDSDVLRLLPDCGHVFHLKCVDPWLRLHPTCPICRTSPAPTPLLTPLAEVAPLAMARRG